MKKVVLLSLLFSLFSLSVFGIDKKQFNHEKSIIYEVLSTQYPGFEDMKKHGFSERKLKSVRNYDELKNCFDKYIDDFHFQINIGKEFSYYQKADSDTTNKSTDPDNTFNIIKTSNTFYVRCNNSTETNPDFFEMASAEIAYSALNFPYIVLDFRSNFGGSDVPIYSFMNVLKNCKYDGKVIITQDRWCFSSGELYGMFYYFTSDCFDKNQLVLVGTNSGGCQLFGTCKFVEKDNVIFWLPTRKMDYIQTLEKYEGEGKGYKPDIYATKDNIKAVIENLGADLTGIEFR